MTRPCNCGKETFGSKVDALKAVRAHQKRLHRNYMYCYWCEHAKGWHISGSQSGRPRGKR